MDVATLGGGCFWCLEAVFEQLIGGESVVSGYTGGDAPSPTYEAVCGGRTGYAEVVRISFDPAVISYRQLLEVFFVIHDPTTLNRQGADAGTQYRSAIFVHSSEQRQIAEGMIAGMTAEGVYSDPIVTVLEEVGVFYPAEKYHQGYFRANPGQGYCAFVVGPKVAKARSAFARLLKPVDR